MANPDQNSPAQSTDQPSINPLQNDLIDSEKIRRQLFCIAVWFAFSCILLLYVALMFWIFYKAPTDKSIIWHVATILVLPPTTLLFFLIKVLSTNAGQNANNSNNLSVNVKDMPLGEVASQVKDFVMSLFGKK